MELAIAVSAGFGLFILMVVTVLLTRRRISSSSRVLVYADLVALGEYVSSERHGAQRVEKARFEVGDESRGQTESAADAARIAEILRALESEAGRSRQDVSSPALTEIA
ncbi:MAG TPA: hypothetical protein VIJ76_06510 [Galbitalea sp.]